MTHRLAARTCTTPRRVLAAAVVTLLATVLTACGGADPAAAPSSGGAFPVSVAHKYGGTEITAAPTRVVTVGLNDQDALLAMGVKPVGVVDWYGDYPNAVWPWQQQAFGGTPPTVVGDSSAINFEAIARLDPDVILASYSGLTRQQYDTLARIAPTVAQPAEFPDYGVPWQENTLRAGRVLGQEARARELVAGVEQRITRVREANPQFAGRTAAATAYETPGTYGVYPDTDPKTRLLTSLGFRRTGPLQQETAQGYGTVSAEQLNLLDVDALVWFVSTTPEAVPEIRGLPVYTRLRVAREGRDLFLTPQDKELNGAISWSTVLSLPRALDQLPPRLNAALDGNPATRP